MGCSRSRWRGRCASSSGVSRLRLRVSRIILILAFAAMIIFDQDQSNYYLSVATANPSASPYPGCWWRTPCISSRSSCALSTSRPPSSSSPEPCDCTSPIRWDLLPRLTPSTPATRCFPQSLIFADDFLHRRRFRSGALLAVALVLLLGAGARGPLLAFVLYLVARAAVALRRRPLVAFVLTASGLAVAVWLNVVAPRILTSMARLFAAQGLSTRAVDRLVAGSFLEDRTREVLVDHSWDLILTHPATGVGLARDRLLLAADMSEHDPEMIRGWYPHNIFLELLMQWGVFVGGLLILVMAR